MPRPIAQANCPGQLLPGQEDELNDELDDEFQKVFGHKPGEGPGEGHETEDEEVEDLNREHGHRVVRSLLDPKLPSEEELHRHNLTHMPYRSWCPHCVRGRGKEMSHRRKKDLEEASVPEYHLDYCFPGDEDGNKLTVLVGCWSGTAK